MTFYDILYLDYTKRRIVQYRNSVMKEMNAMNAANNQNRNLPAGIQDFEKLRELQYVYVDKTEYVYKLVKSSIPFFLS